MERLHAGAASLGLPIEIVLADADGEIEDAFARLARTRGAALMLGPDPTFTSRRVQIVALAARHAIPMMYVAVNSPMPGG
jgi:putative tryptophan/tyrosine transport system substrate-binding protein